MLQGAYHKRAADCTSRRPARHKKKKVAHRSAPRREAIRRMLAEAFDGLLLCFRPHLLLGGRFLGERGSGK